MTIYALGDINIDIIASLGRGERWSGPPTEAPLAMKLGGVALNFLRGCLSFAPTICLLGKIGADDAGDFVYSQLSREGIASRLAIGLKDSTGLILFLFEQKEETSIRHMVRSEGAANESLSLDDVRDWRIDWTSKDVLFCSGYSLFRPRIGRVVAETIAAAQSSGVRVVFDLVPHDLSQLGNPQDFLHIIAAAFRGPVELCVGESHTWRSLFGLSPDSPHGKQDFETIARLSAPLARRIAIRYGTGYCEREAIWDGPRLSLDQDTGYNSLNSPSARLGFSERLTAELVRRVILSE